MRAVMFRIDFSKDTWFVFGLLRKPPLLLSTFTIERKISDDTWNGVPHGDVKCRVVNVNGEFIGDFNYRIKTGQVGGMYLKEQYRFQALEQQMLVYMMKDMQDACTKQIWEVVSNEKHTGDRFYSVLWNFAYKDSHIHPSVTGGGYAMDIPLDIRALPIVPSIGIY